MFQSFKQFSQSVVEADVQPGSTPAKSSGSTSNDPELEEFKNQLVKFKTDIQALLAQVDALDSVDTVSDPAKQKAAISKITPGIQKLFTQFKQDVANMKTGFNSIKAEVGQIKSGKPEETEQIQK